MRRKRTMSLLLALALCINALPVSAAETGYVHIHDDTCGYNEDACIYAQEETETETLTDEPEKMENTSGSGGETEAVAQEISMPETDTEGMTEPSTTGISGETEEIAESGTGSETETVSGTQTETETETDKTDEPEGNTEVLLGSVTDMPAVTLTGETGTIHVTVEAPEGAFLEGVTMAVAEVDAEDYVASAEEMLGEGQSIVDAVAVDITFYDAELEKVEPAAEVQVMLENLSLGASSEEKEEASAEESLVFHVADNGSIEQVSDTEVSLEDGTAVFLAKEFSVYLIASVAEENEITYVAQIGETKYETVAAAISAAGTDDTTIVMIGDSAETITINTNKTITLDLNGYTLDGNEEGTVITVHGTLTLTDSSVTDTNPDGTGKVTNGSASYGGGIYNTGTLTLNGGTVSSNSASGNGGGVFNTGTFTLNGGTISYN
ncbi:MAG: hypothetical protein LIP11_12925, partial [Clostridiales bacterium]|nr:hypothetical protein [Clostridiales bacterium]